MHAMASLHNRLTIIEKIKVRGVHVGVRASPPTYHTLLVGRQWIYFHFGTRPYRCNIRIEFALTRYLS